MKDAAGGVTMVIGDDVAGQTALGAGDWRSWRSFLRESAQRRVATCMFQPHVVTKWRLDDGLEIDLSSHSTRRHWTPVTMSLHL